MSRHRSEKSRHESQGLSAHGRKLPASPGPCVSGLGSWCPSQARPLLHETQSSSFFASDGLSRKCVSWSFLGWIHLCIQVLLQRALASLPSQSLQVTLTPNPSSSIYTKVSLPMRRANSFQPSITRRREATSAFIQIYPLARRWPRRPAVATMAPRVLPP